MGWRDFQVTAPMEFMENMELITPEPSLIPLIPLIPPMRLPENGGVSALPTTADTYRPEMKAWLVHGELRTSGHVEDLAGEIVKLTPDNLPLQKNLLSFHCEAYDKHHFQHLAELWQERAAIMQHDGGLSEEEAEVKAAGIYHCLAFLPELRNNRQNYKQPSLMAA